jgi:hypothetical protein
MVKISNKYINNGKPFAVLMKNGKIRKYPNYNPKKNKGDDING